LASRQRTGSDLQHFAATSRATFGPPNLDQQFKKKQQDQENQSSYCQIMLMCACDISWCIAMSKNFNEYILFFCGNLGGMPLLVLKRD
jgi:hypothetical protein